MSKPNATTLESLVYVEDVNGVTVIPQLSELRRLNWFDGKLLRADDLRVEQDHVRALVRRSNRAGGHGAVVGMTCTLGTDALLHVGPGTAIDPAGRPLLLPVAVTLDIQKLIDRTAAITEKTAPTIDANGFAECVTQQTAGLTPVAGGRWYVITVGWVDGLCGTETVYGNLCQDACTTSTQRPWRMDGLVFRARPIQPVTALATSSAIALGPKHERSRLASALFADEQAAGGSLISGNGLRSPIWCMGAAPTDPVYDEVPLAVIGRQGETTTFLDMWTARRERIEPPPQRYWAGRMAMRPWDVFLAQVLQFQCQLSDLLAGGPGPSGPDPCSEHQKVLQLAIAELEKRSAPVPGKQQPADDVLEKLKKQVLALGQTGKNGGGSHALIDGGIVELPPAGYLPVVLAGAPVEDQVRALLGAGVDLTFCTTRHDAVARALEEAQHLDRISLLRGLDDPKHREEVEIIVPDADLEDKVALRDPWKGRMQIKSAPFRHLEGAGRIDVTDELVVRWAGSGKITSAAGLTSGAAAVAGAFVEANVDSNPFALAEKGETSFSASGDIVAASSGASLVLRVNVSGTFTVDKKKSDAVLDGFINGSASVWNASTDKEQIIPLDTAPTKLTRVKVADGHEVILTVSLGKVQSGLGMRVVLAWPAAAGTVAITAFATPSGDLNLVGIRTDAQAESARAPQTEATANDPWQRFSNLKMQRDPEASSPGNAARTGAESALGVLEEAFDEPDYAEDRDRRLFPEAEPGQHLRPTRDWALFRRRAILRCGGDAPVPVPVKTDSFTIYGFTDSDFQFPMFLGLLRFRVSSADLLEGAGEVASVWDGVAHGGSMESAAILPGSPGQKNLWLARTSGLVNTLKGITPPIPGLNPWVVDADSFLAELDPQGADGVMIVRAKKPVPQVEVAVVGLDPKFASAFRSHLAGGKLAEAIDTAFTAPRILGTVHFSVGDSVPAPSDLQAVKQAYKTAFGEIPTAHLDMFSVKNDADAGSEALREARAKAISKAKFSPDTWEVTENDLKDARPQVTQNSILVLTPELVEAAVLSMSLANLKLYANQLDKGSIPDAMAQAISKNKWLGSIGFEPGTAKPLDVTEVSKVRPAFFIEIGHPFVQGIDVITVTEDNNPASEAIALARGKVVLDAMVGLLDAPLRWFHASAATFSELFVEEPTVIIVIEAPEPPK